MLAFLNLIPGISTLITKVTEAWFNAKVRLVQARIGGDRDVAVQLVKAEMAQAHENTSRLSIFASNKFLTFLLIAFALPLVAYEWKIYIWDTMLGWGTTPAVKGDVAGWANTIIYFLFGAPTAMGLGKLWFNRDKTGQ